VVIEKSASPAPIVVTKAKRVLPIVVATAFLAKMLQIGKVMESVMKTMIPTSIVQRLITTVAIVMMESASPALIVVMKV